MLKKDEKDEKSNQEINSNTQMPLKQKKDQTDIKTELVSFLVKNNKKNSKRNLFQSKSPDRKNKNKKGLLHKTDNKANSEIDKTLNKMDSKKKSAFFTSRSIPKKINTLSSTLEDEKNDNFIDIKNFSIDFNCNKKIKNQSTLNDIINNSLFDKSENSYLETKDKGCAKNDLILIKNKKNSLLKKLNGKNQNLNKNTKNFFSQNNKLPISDIQRENGSDFSKLEKSEEIEIVTYFREEEQKDFSEANSQIIFSTINPFVGKIDLSTKNSIENFSLTNSITEHNNGSRKHSGLELRNYLHRDSKLQIKSNNTSNFEKKCIKDSNKIQIETISKNSSKNFPSKFKSENKINPKNDPNSKFEKINSKKKSTIHPKTISLLKTLDNDKKIGNTNNLKNAQRKKRLTDIEKRIIELVGILDNCQTSDNINFTKNKEILKTMMTDIKSSFNLIN